MREIVVFSKMLKQKTVDELIEVAQEYGFEGYDLCVRPEYPINPDNVGETLGDAVRKMARAGLRIPMITGSLDLLTPDNPTAEPLLGAMDGADVRLLKLGYFWFDPLTQDYWQEVSRIRTALEGWERLARKYNVKVCYHTHNDRCMGLNAAALAHLINGFDPQYIGAYLDPLHLVLEGEEFTFGLAMVQKYLSLVALKDVLKWREEKHGHGSVAFKVVPAGEGMVDWTAVFSDLKRVDYQGPLSMHCEYHASVGDFWDVLKREVVFFKQQRENTWGADALSAGG
jgi:sugar phosphate isomerase/epimerase